jgi:hypothetical protein
MDNPIISVVRLTGDCWMTIEADQNKKQIIVSICIEKGGAGDMIVSRATLKYGVLSSYANAFKLMSELIETPEKSKETTN